MSRLTNASIPGDQFEWPEFKSDRDRIKTYSKRYKNVSIADAFEDVYGIKLVKNEEAEFVPQTYKVGDLIKVRINHISKNNVTFDGISFKTDVVSNMNLHRYDKFKHFLPLDPIEVKVTDVRKDRIVVDPISPVFDGWLKPILKDLKSQRVVVSPKTIKVKDLKLTYGGFTGKAVIPSLSDFTGEEYTVDAFIPGSQIVLNITDDFEQFVGTTVDAFVTNYIPKPGQTKAMSLICSRKEYLKFQGELNIISLFNDWCDDDDKWKTDTDQIRDGIVTGVINSSKNCGVFVEIPDLKTTGMVRIPADQLVNYKPHDHVNVRLVNFEENLIWNSITGQMEHGDAYVIEDGVLRKCNIKPVFTFVESL
jgi:ribosomal protein S1